MICIITTALIVLVICVAVLHARITMTEKRVEQHKEVINRIVDELEEKL